MMKLLLILIAMMTSLLGFAGGGGSDSGGFSGGFSDGFSGEFSGDYSYDDYSYSSSSSSSDPLLTSIAIIVIAILSLPIIITLLRGERFSYRDYRNAGRRFFDEDYDDTEQEHWIHEEAGRIFLQYQKDWSDYNLENIRKYTTDWYFRHASLMLEAIDLAGRRNKVEIVRMVRTILHTPVSGNTETPTVVQVEFVFNGVDNIVDNKTNQLISSDHAFGVTEHWIFVYDQGMLKLDGIDQSTESAPHLVDSLADFAESNGLFYSADWGRLALPTDGLIFKGKNILKHADVNNYVVGKWNNCLVQMYTYSPVPDEPWSYYLVGQINVPKSYKGVIVEANKAMLTVKKPKDYEKYNLEWVDFNKRYNVYAASKDALPAFELLNPLFMERLYNRDLPYNLEVKDNAIYVFARIRKTREKDYAELLNVLTEAFDELKM